MLQRLFWVFQSGSDMQAHRKIFQEQHLIHICWAFKPHYCRLCRAVWKGTGLKKCEFYITLRSEWLCCYTLSKFVCVFILEHVKQCYMRFKCIDICNLCSSRLYRWLLLHQKVIIAIIVRTTVKYCTFIRFRLMKCQSVFFSLGQVQTRLILFHAALCQINRIQSKV